MPPTSRPSSPSCTSIPPRPTSTARSSGSWSVCIADLTYLVCASQRSGSTLLCELLKSTGVAGVPEEYFEAMAATGQRPVATDFLGELAGAVPGLGEAAGETPEYSSLTGVSDYAQHLERTFASGTTPNGVFGAKLMFNQLPQLAALSRRDDPLDLFEDPRYVRVVRSDSVRQAVSMFKALQTQSWRSGGGAGDAPVYDRAAIDHLVRRFAAEDDGWRALFDARGIEPLTISYEHELERDPGAAVHRVLAFIGARAPAGWAPPQTMRRQADATSAEWVAAYHRQLAGQ